MSSTKRILIESVKKYKKPLNVEDKTKWWSQEITERRKGKGRSEKNTYMGY